MSNKFHSGLLHLEIHIHLTAMDLIVQLNPQRLPSSPPLFACPVGMSLLLMPHGTPAYYLGTYAGPTTSSSMEFEENIVGWGIPRSLINETFIICWVPLRRLQERQDGGAIVLWPKALSLVNPSSPKLSFTPSIPFPTKPEPLPSTPHQLNTSQPESSLPVGNSETLDLPSMATAMGEYIDSIIKERQRRPDLPNTSRNPIGESPTQSNFPSSALIGAQGDFATPAINYPSPPDQNLADLLRAIPVNTMMQTPSMEPSASLPEPQLSPVPAPEPEPQDHPMGSWDPFFTGVGNINDGIDSTMFDSINATGLDGLNTFSAVWNDDDFNVFDAPTTIPDTVIADAPAVTVRDIDFGISTIDWTNGMLTAGASTTSPSFQAHITATSGGIFQFPGVGQPSPTPNATAELSSPHHHATVMSSPAKTPFSVLHEIEIPNVMQVDAPPDGDMFSKIEFLGSRAFDEADDKYLRGKFSLPSPPSDFQVDARAHYLQNRLEEDKRKNGDIPWNSGLVRGGDIRTRYIDATNPRLGILHAISGGVVKSTRMPKEKPAGRQLQWKEEDEPWRLATPPAEAESEISDESSGEEIDVSDTEAVSPGFQGQAAAPIASTTTGSTPEGSRFLQARFDFSYIVKKGLAVVYDPATALTSAAPTMSVPTPVSPNTGAGGGDVHGRVSSQIAGRVAIEAAENVLWAASIRAWGSSGKRQEGPVQFECQVLEKMIVEALGVPLITLQEYVGVDGVSNYYYCLQIRTDPIIIQRRPLRLQHQRQHPKRKAEAGRALSSVIPPLR
jgi:mediator of RNA polymerase II transcription subunit 13